MYATCLSPARFCASNIATCCIHTCPHMLAIGQGSKTHMSHLFRMGRNCQNKSQLGRVPNKILGLVLDQFLDPQIYCLRLLGLMLELDLWGGEGIRSPPVSAAQSRSPSSLSPSSSRTLFAHIKNRMQEMFNNQNFSPYIVTLHYVTVSLCKVVPPRYKLVYKPM